MEYAATSATFTGKSTGTEKKIVSLQIAKIYYHKSSS
jgi:hypothetical protein